MLSWKINRHVNYLVNLCTYSRPLTNQFQVRYDSYCGNRNQPYYLLSLASPSHSTYYPQKTLQKINNTTTFILLSAFLTLPIQCHVRDIAIINKFVYPVLTVYSNFVSEVGRRSITTPVSALTLSESPEYANHCTTTIVPCTVARSTNNLT